MTEYDDEPRFFSIYGWIYHHVPGNALVKKIILLLAVVVIFFALMQVIFPWIGPIITGDPVAG